MWDRRCRKVIHPRKTLQFLKFAQILVFCTGVRIAPKQSAKHLPHNLENSTRDLLHPATPRGGDQAVLPTSRGRRLRPGSPHPVRVGGADLWHQMALVNTMVKQSLVASAEGTWGRECVLVEDGSPSGGQGVGWRDGGMGEGR